MALERQVGDGIDAALAADLFIPAGITERKEHFRKSSEEQEILDSPCCKYISFNRGDSTRAGDMTLIQCILNIGWDDS